MSTNRSPLFQRAGGSDSAQTVLPEGASVEGTFTCNGPTLIGGSVIGEVLANDTLLIESSAKINANVQARDVQVFGAIKGDVVAGERIVLASTATIDGNLFAPCLSMEEGAKVSGKVTIKEDAVAASRASLQLIQANDIGEEEETVTEDKLIYNG